MGQDPLAFLRGGGELGERIRAFDWSKTPLGPVDRWPQALRVAVRIMLTSRQPIWIGWGQELIYLYNDPYKSIIGGRHPWALGKATSAVWREIWNEIGPMLSTAMSGDEGTYVEAQLLIMERNGYPEETYYTFSYSPIPNDDGSAGGIICANTDDTQRVIGERQLALLRELASYTAEARTFQEACQRSAAALGTNPWDLPFAMMYVAEPGGGDLLLRASRGIDAGHPAAPAALGLDGLSPWPVREVLSTHSPMVVDDLPSLFGDELPRGAWTQSPGKAAVLPIQAAGETGRAGVLITGLNPFRLWDTSYRGFLDLVAGQIAASIANAEAYEEERKRAESLAELDRAKTAFFSNVSHEFRTPLTLMLGPVEDLLERSELSPEVTDQLEVVNRNGLRLLRLVNTLLDFSRIEAGRVRAVYQATDLASFTADLASVFRSTIERAGLRFTVDCAPLGDAAYVDRDMWERIVLNLLSNAFKFTFEGEIGVTLRQTGHTAELRVRDTGSGIPAEEMPNLFKRFHRVENAGGRTHEGSGIGLALVQELVRLHGGWVSAESELGRGTTFVVTVPLGSAHLPPDQVAERSSPGTSRMAAPFVEDASRWLPRDKNDSMVLAEPAPEPSPGEDQHDERPLVLVADDNADMRQYVSRLLSSRFRVVEVSDGEAALAAVRQQRPELVLTDIMMPKLGGIELVKELRADDTTRALPVIMLSARAGEESRVEGLDTGADDYLVKPFSARELVSRVTAHLQMARIRQEASRSLRAGEERLRMALTAGRMLAWEWDPVADKVVVSDNVAEVYGLPPGSTIESAEQAFPLMHPDDVDRHRAAVEQAVSECGSYVSQFRILRPDNGQVVWVEERAQAVPDENGNTSRVVGVVMDITERKRAEEALLESEKRLRQASKMEAIGRLAGGISHDFNNQLQGISGFADFVARDPALGARARQDLAEVQKAADRMSALTRQLLAFSRQQILQPETLDLNAAVIDGRTLLQRLIGTNIEMELELDSGPLWVRADPAQLLQVLMNLSINARDAMPDGGRLAIGTRRRQVNGTRAGGAGVPAEVKPGSYVELVVTDTGAGIEPEHQPHLFEPFFTTKEVGQGTGLGLATVHGIIAQSQGYIWAESEPGDGATFTILLPAVTAKAGTGATARRSIPEMFRPARVLVVDDDDTVRRIVVRTLGAEGYDVLQARNGRQAFECLQKEGGTIDLVVTDVVMPILGGVEYGVRLTREYPDLPVVWMSGYPMDGALPGVTDRQPFLQKPVPADVLVGTVRNILARRSAQSP